MSEDDTPPAGKKRRPPTATDRDFETMARLEGEKLAKAAKAARDAAKGTGDTSVDPDLTPVEDLIREVNDDVAQQERDISALGFGPLREAPDAATRRIVASGVKVMARHTSVAVARCAEYTHGERVIARLAEIERKVSFWQRVAFAAAGLAVSGVVAFVAFVYRRGVTEGANETRLQFLERAVYGRPLGPATPFNLAPPPSTGGTP